MCIRDSFGGLCLAQRRVGRGHARNELCCAALCHGLHVLRYGLQVQRRLTMQQGFNARGQARPVGLGDVKVTAQVEQRGLFDHGSNAHAFDQTIGVVDLFGLFAVGGGASDKHTEMIRTESGENCTD